MAENYPMWQVPKTACQDRRFQRQASRLMFYSYKVLYSVFVIKLKIYKGLASKLI